ncbi:protocadherin gamma-C5-like [Narcine bancroftii]|uniref:protocadherin gamma-C5-like n=1 Tax=Narcine bancroftii TaxID=1343680 RepID=UPI003832009F
MANSAISNTAAFQIFAFLILVCTEHSIAGEIRYSIPEEMEEGAFVGNVAQDLGLEIQQLFDRNFMLTSDDGVDYINIELQRGILSIAKKIDREQICGQETACTISFKIILENPLAVYRGEVEILDVNDNTPTFSEGTIALQIAESMAPGVGFPLESAQDQDVGINAVAAYTISSSAYFRLKTQTSDDGVIAVELLLEKSLDRELKSSLRLVLTAIDGGIPQRSGTTQILITVMDINDNPPVFDHKIYRSSLRENAPLGSLVVTVKANDLDDGPNADLTYSFSKLTSPTLREMFSCDPYSGEIRTNRKLDFEKSTSYSLHLQAVDHGSPAITGHSQILVKIIDVNDNAPEIKVTSTTCKIMETVLPGTLITLVNVIDRDSGENGQINCEVSGSIPFKLQTSSSNHYELITSEELDRESVPEYEVVLVAWDFGSPSLSTNKTIQIVITDVNDNAPLFSEPSYNMYLTENNAPGTSIFAITATDPDMDQNSYVSYSLVWNNIQDTRISSFLSINALNGTIYALRSFDYEKLKTFQIHVQARDAGVPPLSSSAAVNVIILDQNDNAPVIVSPSAQSGSASAESLPQSADQGYFVTKIIATDADSGQNARLFYQVHHSTDPTLFNIEQNSGEIRTARRIFESDTSMQTLVILVTDNGQPRLSSTVTIHISFQENVTERITERNNLVSNSEYDSNLHLYLIVVFGCTSLLFLVTIILLIGIKCKQEGTVTQDHNSSSCCYRLGGSNDVLDRRYGTEETLRYPGTGRIVRVGETPHYSVCLSPESAKSDFLFLKPCGRPTSQP